MATSYMNELVPPPPPPPLPLKDNARNDATLPIMSSLGHYVLLCDTSSSLTPMLGLDIPLSPVSPSSLPSAMEKTRKYSPLTDLIESEKAYVELLTGIIRVRLTSPLHFISCLIVCTTESGCCLVTIESSPTRTRRHVSQCGRGIQDESHALGSETPISPDAIVSNSS